MEVFVERKKKISQVEFTSGLKNLKEVVSQDGYFCLKGREKIIIRRQMNLSELTRKMQLARNVASKLSTIPSILFIGVSGGLAVGDAEKKDDIDLFIITQKDTLFTTRFLILSILQGLGVRRMRNQKNTSDTVCVNLLLDETAIGWFAKKKDVYIAREIAQILPFFERENMYQRFLYANNWIQQSLPNTTQKASFSDTQKSTKFLFNEFFLNRFTETALRVLQIQWMRHHQTNEVITQHLLSFHPNDYRTSTLKQLRLRMRQFGLLTKF